MKVICPSGLTGEIRKLKGKEANNLADRKLARKGETFDHILRGCWVQTESVGPYENVGVRVGESSISWGNILVCDRFYILAAIRVHTYGPDYLFKAQCGSDGSGCGEKFEWEIDITKDLDVFDLPEESRVKVAAGNNRFDLEFHGNVFTHKLLTGVDERKASNLVMKNRNQIVTTSIAQRIISVDDITRSQEIREFLENMDLDVQLELLDLLEEVDGGIETEFEVECPRCENVFRAPVPLEGEAFWIPRKQSRKKAKQSKRAKRTMNSDS